MDIIVYFGSIEYSRMESDWVDVAIHFGQEDGYQGMVQSICFNNH